MSVIPGSIRQTVKSSTVYAIVILFLIPWLELLSLIKDVESDYRIVQVDPYTLKIIDSVSSMYEILDSGVYRTDNAI